MNITLENLEKDLKNYSTIKGYLLANINYYDFLMYTEKQKIMNMNLLEDKYDNSLFIHYEELRNLYLKILNDLENSGVRDYE